MAVYVVAYDLNKETVRPKIVAEVHKTAYARLSESSYAIATSESTGQVHARFKKHLDDNDDFFVITLRKPYDGYGPKAVIEWLNANLPG
jgi:CRISPR/Cas system-associated endoribonuclease Cas2